MTDNLSAAVNNFAAGGSEFQKRYSEFMKYYKMSPRKINPYSPNENGSSEKSHDIFKTAIDQTLMLRGTRNFINREEYETFLQTIFDELNSGRKDRLQEELDVMGDLPDKKIDTATIYEVRVNSNSTINVKKKRYSLPSRLIGEMVKVKLYSDYLEVQYAQKIIGKIPRLIGGKDALINYRHIIDSLIRKPGAFQNYIYKSELFPTVNFRVAHDSLEKYGKKGIKQYLQLLKLAADEGEEGVNKALQTVNLQDKELAKTVKELLESTVETTGFETFFIEEPNLAIYGFLTKREYAES